MMKISLFVDEKTPLEGGVPLELVGDGDVLAAAETNADGVVEFDADPTGINRLGIRLDQKRIEESAKSADSQQED